MTKKNKTPQSVADHPYAAAMIRAAKRGDVQAAATCLYLVGRALQNQQLPDPALALYVGDCLTNTAVTSAVANKKTAETTTEKRARDVARDLGLIATRRGPHTSRFEPYLHWSYVVSLVIHFHEQKFPLTRKENGAFFKAAKVSGCSPAGAEAAYIKFKKSDASLGPEWHKTALDWAAILKKVQPERS